MKRSSSAPRIRRSRPAPAPTYPFVGSWRGNPSYLVLFAAPGEGTRLQTGEHYTTRNMDDYRPFEGEICLRNKP